MKKKLLAVVATMVMVVSTAVTAFAFPSTEAFDVSIDSAIDKDGDDLTDSACHEIRVRPLEEKDRPSAEEVSAQSNLKLVLGDRYVEGLKVIQAADVYVWDVEEQKIIDWMYGAEYHFPVTITFKVPGVKEDSVIRLIQGYDGENGKKDGTISMDEWFEMEIVSIGKDTVTVTCTKLSDGSPVLFLMTGGSDAQSPTTGENNVMLYAGLVAVAALAGVLVTGKSLKATK